MEAFTAEKIKNRAEAEENARKLVRTFEETMEQFQKGNCSWKEVSAANTAWLDAYTALGWNTETVFRTYMD